MSRESGSEMCPSLSALEATSCGGDVASASMTKSAPFRGHSLLRKGVSFSFEPAMLPLERHRTRICFSEIRLLMRLKSVVKPGIYSTKPSISRALQDGLKKYRSKVMRPAHELPSGTLLSLLPFVEFYLCSFVTPPEATSPAGGVVSSAYAAKTPGGTRGTVPVPLRGEKPETDLRAFMVKKIG